MQTKLSDKKINKLKNIFDPDNKVRSIKDDKFIQAAIMIILGEMASGYSMLFIKRSENATDVFSGHIAFPGGKMIGSDNNKLETAIRETHEETGIDISNKAEIIGELEDINPNNPKANHYIVTPFIAILNDNVKIVKNEEVAEVIWVPVSVFKDKLNFEERLVYENGIKNYEIFYHYQNYTIWGMTARIVYRFISLAGHLF